jgi:cytochrome c-type biogenesis protein CcmH/NrfF
VRAALAALLTLLALAPAALAPGALAAPAPRASFNDIEDEVMCDTCNVPLNIADSPRADQERQVIRRLIARGLTKGQVKAELERQYGPNILASPHDSGFGLAAWWVPVAVVAAVLALLVALVPRWRRRPPGGPSGDAVPAAPALSAADARRLDEDLARYDA